jgi:large subunit ribosomal protein L24
MNIRKNDSVQVVAGNARGKTGKVLKVFTESERVIVEGVNIIKRHSRPTQKNPQGGIIQKEESVHVSNVMVICPKCGERSRLGSKQVTDAATGRRHTMRICRSCEEMF